MSFRARWVHAADGCGVLSSSLDTLDTLSVVLFRGARCPLCKIPPSFSIRARALSLSLSLDTLFPTAHDDDVAPQRSCGAGDLPVESDLRAQGPVRLAPRVPCPVGAVATTPISHHRRVYHRRQAWHRRDAPSLLRPPGARQSSVWCISRPGHGGVWA